MATFVTGGSVLPGTSLANIMEQSWRPRFGLEAQEELVVARGFSGADGVAKIGNTLNISKVLVKTSNNLSTSGQVDAGALSFEADTETNVAITARGDYGAVSLSRDGLMRLLRSTDYQAGVKRQLMMALTAGVDVQAGSLVPSLSTSIVGSGAVPISKSLLLAGLGKLIQNAKNMFKLGETTCYLTVYNLQASNLLNIPEITAANVRGDSMNPNVTGRVWTAWGMSVAESGNISTSGGAAHNLLHIPDSHVLGYNQEPDLLDPQDSGLATFLIAYTSYAVGEVFDEWAVDIQSQTT